MSNLDIGYRFKYPLRIGIQISCLFNVILFGPTNQTFSARNYGWKLEGKFNLVWLIDLIMFLDKNHCEKTWLYWASRVGIKPKKTLLNKIAKFKEEQKSLKDSS